MSSAPFVALVDPSAGPLLPALSLIVPLLIPSSLVQAVKADLPASATYYALASESDDIISLLDAGAQKVVLSLQQAVELDGQVPKERLIVRESDDLERVSAVAGGLLLASSSEGQNSTSGAKGQVQVYVQPRTASIEQIRSAGDSNTVVLSTSQLTTGPSTSTHVSIADAFTARLVSDRSDGLFPTIVTSADSGVSLGLVYSSRESIAESINTQKGVYQSRKHGLWRKGESSGAVQDVVSIRTDCDSDALLFSVVQHGTGFCHLPQQTCFGDLSGLSRLESTLRSRLASAPEGSYTKRLFTDEKLLQSKIMEEAEELCQAQTKDEVAFEAADLVYFALTRCIAKGVGLRDIAANLDKKHLKVTRRRGDAKPKWEEKVNNGAPHANASAGSSSMATTATAAVKPDSKPSEPVPADFPEADGRIKMRTVKLSTQDKQQRAKLLLRPVLNSLAMIDKVKPIVERVRREGDAGLKALTKQFDKADLSSNVLRPPFATPSEEQLPTKVKEAIERAYTNVKKFHAAQSEKEPLVVETMPGVVCSRFVRPIARVGIYVPGGTAVLPSTAIHLGVPAQVSGCHEIVLATPPRPDGSISPEVLYVAQLVGVTCILKAGGAQAVGAMAYGTDEVPKVDKIFGPGNQWVTAAKMLVQNDTDALVAIDMPAGPSEVLVIADKTANPVYVASDLLSQAEHGTDSQVVLVAVDLSDKLLADIEEQIDVQAKALPRVAIAREAIKKSLIVLCDSLEEGVGFSNEYAPEHLILQLDNASGVVQSIDNAGSIFVGPYTPESCGDLASGTNHTLPTNGFARQYPGVNTLSFQKHITSQEITAEGLKLLGPTVVTLAETEGLEAHANAVRVRLQQFQ